MKIGGINPKEHMPDEVLVLPRGENLLVFKARGLPDMEEFTKLCPEPKPPGKLTKDGWVPNTKDKNYETVLAEYQKRRLAYMVIKSLEPSEIEWETVSVNNPGTWANWETDMRNAGLTNVEINRIIGLVMEANCLDEVKLKKARDAFLLGPPQVPAEYSGLSTEPASTPSGEPAQG